MGLFDRLNLDKLRQGVEAGVKTAQEGVASIKVDKVVKGAVDAAATGVNLVSQTIQNVTGASGGTHDDSSSVKDFVSLLLLLSYVDGNITDEEMLAISGIASSLDEDFETYAVDLKNECIQKVMDASADFGMTYAAKVEAQRIVEAMTLSGNDAKLLCWNLLAVANADGLDEAEFDFIRFVARKADLAEATLEELRNYSDAIVEIECATDDLKHSNRGYAEIEPLVNEYAKREQTIVEAAQALITDR